MNYDQTLQAMKDLAGQIATLYQGLSDYGHPIDLTTTIEPEYLKAAKELSAKLSDQIPKLCSLVTASPSTRRYHAYGRYHGRSAYQLLGPEFLTHSLDHYLGDEFRGERLHTYIRPTPVEKLPLYHLVGALDPITDSDIRERVNDGLPETLPEWIRYNGLLRIKIKLAGNDVAWDVNRVAAVHRATAETQQKRGVTGWYCSLDFNEKCHDVESSWNSSGNWRRPTPAHSPTYSTSSSRPRATWRRIPIIDMHEAASLKPVVIDESLTGLGRTATRAATWLLRGGSQGVQGHQTQSLLLAALAQKHKLFLCVQDLTCPGASLIESAGLAAHIPGVAAIEANARQFVPVANRGWEKKYPGIFVVRDGYVRCGDLKGPGLGFV